MTIKDAYRYNILVVDDFPPMRRMIKKIIEANPDMQVIGELNDGRELLKFLKKCQAHLILLDISMPNLSGFEATRKVKEDHPETKVLILSIHRYLEYVKKAMFLGADGYLLKDEVGNELLPAISSLRQGRTFISQGLADPRGG